MQLDVEELYCRYGQELYRYVVAVTGDREAARDILQETMLAVWLERDLFRGDCSARTWVYRIARNKVADYFRNRRRRRNDTLRWEDVGERADGGGGESAEPETIPSAVHVDHEVSEKSSFWRAFGRLPPGQREVMLLVFYAGFSQSEVADVLGIPMDTVRSRVYHGRRKLARFLEEEEHAL